MARDLVRMVNDYRKQRELKLSDQINLVLSTQDEQLQAATEEHQEYIKAETQSVTLTFQDEISDELATECEIGEAAIKIFLTVAESVSG